MFKQFFIGGVAAGLMLAGCADDSLAPVIVVDELEVGAFPRLIAFPSNEYDLRQLDATNINYSVEFFDEERGANVANYKVFARFEDRDTTNGDQSKPEMLLRDINAADFGTSEAGLPSVSITIPSSEIVQKFGLNPALLRANDRVRYRTTVTKEDGSVFGVDNSTSAITAAFRGLLDFNANYTCPLPTDFLIGEYVISYTGGNPDAGLGPIFGPAGRTVTLRRVAGSSTRRQFSTVYLPTNATASRRRNVAPIVDFVCSTTSPVTINAGFGCGAGNVEIGTGGLGTFDINDDRSFVVNYRQGSATGGCSEVARTNVQVTFTKK